MERTFAMVKPDAVQDHVVGLILTRIEMESFVICRMELTRLYDLQVDALYGEHIERPFYAALKAFTLSGPVVILMLERDEAAARWRYVMGATDSRNADHRSIRGQFGNKDGVIYRNAVHGSDGAESAKRELRLFWP